MPRQHSLDPIDPSNPGVLASWWRKSRCHRPGCGCHLGIWHMGMELQYSYQLWTSLSWKNKASWSRGWWLIRLHLWTSRCHMGERSEGAVVNTTFGLRLRWNKPSSHVAVFISKVVSASYSFVHIKSNVVEKLQLPNNLPTALQCPASRLEETKSKSKNLWQHRADHQMRYLYPAKLQYCTSMSHAYLAEKVSWLSVHAQNSHILSLLYNLFIPACWKN